MTGPTPQPVLEELRRTWEERPENLGELRLVAWVPRPVRGQVFEPALDRHRGMTAVLVHLRYGNPPAPDTPRFNLLAATEVEQPIASPERPSRGCTAELMGEGRAVARAARAGLARGCGESAQARVSRLSVR